jgi:uncharacterized protein YyaL (SSP411 family)
VDDFCRSQDISAGYAAPLLNSCRSRLLEVRNRRIRPLRDDKIITSWNGLMISALATAGIAFGNEEYLKSAGRAASFILSSLRRSDGRLLRSGLNGAADVPAFLEDYAFLAAGLLDLYEATLDQSRLTEAEVLTNQLLTLFRDPATGEFTLTGHDAEQMPARVASDHDGVTPSTFATTAHVLYRLSWLNNRPELLDIAVEALKPAKATLQRNPLGHLGALQVYSLLTTEPAIATFTGRLNSTEAFVLNAALHRHAFRNLIIRCENSTAPTSLAICLPGVCLPVVSNAQALDTLLSRHDL